MDSKTLLNAVVSLRRQIHRFPELGNREFKTAGLVESVLKKWGIPSKRVPPTGVVGILRGGGSGKCVALRADMDALPLTEKSGKPYRSRNPGVMHACGHDAHVAMLLGAGMLLSRNKNFNGTVKLLFQPNEEGAGGAASLIKKGVMAGPKVDAVFGLHVNPRLPTGVIGVKPGPLMAAVDKFSLEVIGEGGHAAYPHEGNDAVTIAAELIQSLQTIVSRKTDPLEPAVLTIGTLQGGTRYNILADRVRMTGTVRTLSEELQAQMPRWIRRTAEGVCRAHGAKFVLDYQVLGSVLSNDKAMADLAGRTAVRLFGEKNVAFLDRASMGAEDFSEYLKRAPGCFIYLGTGNRSLKTAAPWHNPEFDLDEKALPNGSRLLAELAAAFLNR